MAKQRKQTPKDNQLVVRGRKPPDGIKRSPRREFLYEMIQDSRKYNRDMLTLQMLDYTEQTELPIIAEFVTLVGVERSHLTHLAEGHPPLRRAIELCKAKKEARLEQGGLRGDFAPAVTIFSLKQLGWRDTQAHELTGANGGPIEVKRSADDFTDDELAAIASRSRHPAIGQEKG